MGGEGAKRSCRTPPGLSTCRGGVGGTEGPPGAAWGGQRAAPLVPAVCPGLRGAAGEGEPYNGSPGPGTGPRRGREPVPSRGHRAMERGWGISPPPPQFPTAFGPPQCTDSPRGPLLPLCPPCLQCPQQLLFPRPPNAPTRGTCCPPLSPTAFCAPPPLGPPQCAGLPCPLVPLSVPPPLSSSPLVLAAPSCSPVQGRPPSPAGPPAASSPPSLPLSPHFTLSPHFQPPNSLLSTPCLSCPRAQPPRCLLDTPLHPTPHSTAPRSPGTPQRAPPLPPWPPPSLGPPAPPIALCPQSGNLREGLDPPPPPAHPGPSAPGTGEP